MIFLHKVRFNTGEVTLCEVNLRELMSHQSDCSQWLFYLNWVTILFFLAYQQTTTSILLKLSLPGAQ